MTGCAGTEEKMQVLAICGSLREKSSNAAVLDAARRLAPPQMTVTPYTGLSHLPHFNPDLDTESPPAEVLDLRRWVGRSDALLICSPEYARGVAGVLKNALDWLVSSFEFPGKPVALINASQRAVQSDAQLRLILETMSALLVEPASITLPLMGTGLDAEGIVVNPGFAAPLQAALDHLAEAITARD